MTTSVTAALVADVMVRAPKVHGPSLTADDIRVAFTDDHVHMLLLVETGRLVGTLMPGDVPADVPSSEPVLSFATTSGRTVLSSEAAHSARSSMIDAGLRRLAVVDDDGSLLGLICLKRHLGGFCSDADVAARAAERRGRG